MLLKYHFIFKVLKYSNLLIQKEPGMTDVELLHSNPYEKNLQIQKYKYSKYKNTKVLFREIVLENSLAKKSFNIQTPFFSRRFSREKCPTLTVDSFFLFFFVRLQSHSDWATFLTIETTKTTSIRGQVRSAEISAKGSPLHFLPFLRNLQNRKRPKGPPFQFFCRHCAKFFSKIF